MAKQKTTDSWDGIASNSLKGSDLKATKGNEFVVTEVSVEEMPDGKEVLTLKGMYDGKEYALYCNKTNANKLKELVNAPRELVGKKLLLKQVLATNPQTSEEVESIRVESLG